VGRDCLLQKNAQGKRRNEGGREECRSSGYKLNIIDNITDRIIMSVS
jgi:hypothetical protein